MLDYDEYDVMLLVKGMTGWFEEEINAYVQLNLSKYERELFKNLLQ